MIYLYKNLKLKNLFIFQILIIKILILILNNFNFNINIFKILIFYFYNFLIIYNLNNKIYLNNYFINNNYIFNKLHFNYNYYNKIILKKKIVIYKNFNININKKNLYKILLFKIKFLLNNKIINKNKNLLYKINFINKILEIKRISNIKKNNKKRNFKLIFIFGNKSGWVGFGIGYDIYISKAILKAKKKSLRNIKYFKITKSKTITNVIKIKFKNIIIILKPFYINKGFKIPLSLKPIFFLLGIINIWVKIIGPTNKLNLIYFIFYIKNNLISFKEIFKFKNFNFFKIKKNFNIKNLLNLLINFN